MNKTVWLLTLLLIQGTAAEELYRYQDSSGITVTADTISPLAAAEGYEIVNELGQVLRVVMAQPVVLTDVEQRMQDRYLLSSFSQVAEITQLKNRKLALLAREIENLKNNLHSLQVRAQTYIRDAAHREMAGEAVPEALRQQISQLGHDAAELQNILSTRQADETALTLRYRHYEERLRQLKGVQ